MPIACFDLDGTITRHDTLLPLVLRQLARRPLRLLRLLGVVAGRGALPRGSRPRRAQAVPVARHAARHAARRAATLSRDFVRDTIESGCFREALATFRRHRDAGHHLVLMSASVDFYVPEFGRQLGFDQVISTGVRFDGDRLEGTLTTANRRGEEKARCLQRAARPSAPTPKPSPTATATRTCRICGCVRHGVLVNGSHGRPARGRGARRRHASIGLITRPKRDADHSNRARSRAPAARRGRRIGRQSHSDSAPGNYDVALESSAAARKCL